VVAVAHGRREYLLRDAPHRCGHRDDPVYKIRGLLRRGAENLFERQIARLDAALDAGDPDYEVTVTWQCYQQLRSIYHATHPATRRAIAERVMASFATCPVPEVARLGGPLRAWRVQVLAYFDTGGVSNGGTEAINGIIEKTETRTRLRNFTNYRLRMLLAANCQLTYRRARPTKPGPSSAAQSRQSRVWSTILIAVRPVFERQTRSD
jgi:transposase